MVNIKQAFTQSFYHVDVIALSHSKTPTQYVMQDAFPDLAGVVKGEDLEWIGLLI